MAYQPTRTTYVLGAVIGIAVIASIAWNTVIRDRWEHRNDAKPAATASANSSNTGSAGGTSVAPSAAAVVQAKPGTGPLGGAGNPLRVSLVSFHGYAPALVANGNSLTTKPGSIYARMGLNVEFMLNDNVPTSTTLIESKAAQCFWRTSDSWAQDQVNLVNSGHDGRAIIVVDNTQGADAIIAKDPKIRSIEDLAGKSVALVKYSPSHGLLIDAIENSSLTARGKTSIKPVFIDPEAGQPEVRSTFVAGNTDAAVIWDPDLSMALREANAHVVYSTKTASNLIFDVMVCDQAELKRPENVAMFQNFVDGWLEGVTVSQQNPDKAVDALLSAEPYYKTLADSQGAPFVRSLFKNLRWTDLSDNARILGLAGGTNQYERVYARFDRIYREAGSLANPRSPVVDPQNSFDYRFIKTALARDEQAKVAAQAPVETFSDKGRAAAMAQPAQITKPVLVTFASGTADLSKRAQQVIDHDMVPFIENNGSGYVELSGNTDSVGSTGGNLALSKARAAAVADYLFTQWEIPRNRLLVTGAGSGNPLCDESNPEASGMAIDDCRAMNRSTRLAVHAR